MAGVLYLIPVSLGGNPLNVLPASTLEVIHRLRLFIAENPKSARAFLKHVNHPVRVQDIEIETLDEHTPTSRLASLLDPIRNGTACGLLSDAGCPAVADPGADLVRRAHESGLNIVPLVGPSALLLALMASGLNGQHFAFHGYLPVERNARTRRLISLEEESEHKGVTQMFIEAPYRNEALFDAIVEVCKRDTLLCVAADLTLSTEFVSTRSIERWKADPPELNRRPTIFLIYRERNGRVKNAPSFSAR